jgi:multiple sugar transport system permease protein
MRGAISGFRDGRSFDVTLVTLALLYLFIFAALPMLYTVLMSVQKIDMFTLGTLSRPFVCLRNYERVLRMPEAWRIARNTGIFVFLSVFFQLVIGLALAIFFQQKFPGASTLRGLFLAGWVMPALVVGAIWRWLLAGDFGVVNYLLASIGLIHNHIFWISDPHVALYSVVIANIWLGIPFNMLLLSVGLAAVPGDVYEAAAIDGARLHHPAADARDFGRGHLAEHNLHSAAIRPDRRSDPGWAVQRLQRRAILVLAAVLRDL